jgi:hypothetical protein
VARTDLDAIVLPRYASNRTRGSDDLRVLRHEWAHIGLAQHLEGLSVPRWFHEGYAEYASGGWDAQEGWKLRAALALGNAPPLDSLSLDWPRDTGQAGLAYMLSGSAVDYLMRSGGEPGLRLFLARWRTGGSFEAALRSTYGVTFAQFEEDWIGHVKRRYGWLLLLSHSVMFWLFLSLALGALFLMRRGRTRERLARLRAAEPPDRPAYWDEPGDEAAGAVAPPANPGDPAG